MDFVRGSADKETRDWIGMDFSSYKEKGSATGLKQDSVERYQDLQKGDALPSSTYRILLTVRLLLIFLEVYQITCLVWSYRKVNNA